MSGVGFRYEWWTVKIKYSTGVCLAEFKAKNKEGAIRQIEKEIAKPRGMYSDTIIEVYWDTLTLDRVGYQRLS